MCGLIAAASLGPAIDRGRFDRARDCMAHRGPDGAGSEYFADDSVALGHRRLAIIDLTDAGRQPMRLGQKWVVFNGEIYNFPELRRELEAAGCQFKSNSDTEVLLHGFNEWGQSLCRRLRGMFAFVIFDEVSKELFLARDHVGQKPLYFAQVGDSFVAASEIKAIRSYLGPRFTMRNESILDFLVYGYVPDPNSWYQEVRSVLPGNCLRVTHREGKFRLVEQEYWDFRPPVEPQSIERDDALHLLDTAVRSAVKSHLLADVSVGALLSGGVDSGSVVAMASRISDAPLQTFSIGFESRHADETKLARLVADKYSTHHTERIVTESQYQSSISDLLDTFDQPFADTSLVPTNAVCALASESVKVVLTGDGGDETFGGYNLGTYISPFHDKELLRNLRFNRRSANDLVGFLRNAAAYLAMSESGWRNRRHYPRYRQSVQRELSLMPKEFRDLLADYEWRWMYPNYTVPGLDAFRQAQWHHIKNILPGKMLVKIDRCAMRHSLESRAPFLAPDLIEAMLSLPTAVKNPNRNWYKGLLRDWAKELLPPEILSAPKRGFGVPKDWTVRTLVPNGADGLGHVLGAGALSERAWPTLQRREGLLWKVLQIERAMAEGML